jgi:hypothetical protein
MARIVHWYIVIIKPAFFLCSSIEFETLLQPSITLYWRYVWEDKSIHNQRYESIETKRWCLTRAPKNYRLRRAFHWKNYKSLSIKVWERHMYYNDENLTSWIFWGNILSLYDAISTVIESIKQHGRHMSCLDAIVFILNACNKTCLSV